MTPPALRLTGRALIGGTPIFGPLTLEVEAGKWTCILGPSGAGKSSLLHLFAGIADQIVLEGQVGATDGRPLANRVALMAQSDMLMPWLTARDNVLLGPRLRGAAADCARADAMLGRVGLAGLEGRKPGRLSGGQRQRVALARTLVEDRPVALLDEPFSALDVATRISMQNLAAAELEGRTVLHVTHDPAEAARLGERIIVMTPRGLVDHVAPETPAPRNPIAPETLEATGALVRQLLESA